MLSPHIKEKRRKKTIRKVKTEQGKERKKKRKKIGKTKRKDSEEVSCEEHSRIR